MHSLIIRQRIQRFFLLQQLGNHAEIRDLDRTQSINGSYIVGNQFDTAVNCFDFQTFYFEFS
ncbi:hypothetical protein C3E97_003210 [Pseudomonas sp. MWU12-2115]|nr:hypothetical protein C3E97_003210 [Pseudomonas sp. MWU12-2115]